MPRLSREAWINKFGREEVERLNLDVVPCYCNDDPACAGWQVVYPGGTPTRPTTPDNLTRRELYNSAIATIERLVRGLSDDGSNAKPCASCGVLQYENRNEFLERRSLVKIKSKLNELKGQLTK